MLAKLSTFKALRPWIAGASVLAVIGFQPFEGPLWVVVVSGVLALLAALVVHFRQQTVELTRRYEQTQAHLLASREEVALQEQRAIAKAQHVDELQEAHKQLRILAHYDGLTSLPNRLSFQEHLEKCIRRNLRHDRALAVVFIDLDGFKNINDSFGHRIGDDLLVAMARRLRKCARYEDFIARLSGDEFSIILTELANIRDAAIVARRVVHALAEPVFLDGQRVRVTASVGVAAMPSDGQTADVLLDKADQAMYAAKRDGRNRYRLFSDLQREPMDVLDVLDETLMARPSARPHSPMLETRA